MRRISIHDQESRSLCVVQQAFEEFDELAGIHMPFNSHESHIAAGD